ncbi:MAG: DNA-3-methyladenine glycosylase [Prolixibacteraceae bacterium]|nr:DNA-3-methyladenine glycosylase [Prolixibacteraceae bacterium]
MGTRLSAGFYRRDVLEVAPQLLGKTLIREIEGFPEMQFTITEVEAYRGTDDLACHASKGRTPRTGVMFETGGKIYVYLIYGMYWLLNIVTGKKNDASAVLIRGVEGISGPGRIGKALHLDKSFYGEDLCTSQRLWIEDPGRPAGFYTAPRIGIDYAGEPWVSKPWRFILKQ